jgi:hypothetical protein
MKLQMQSAAKVGERIGAVVKSASIVVTEIASIAVQCALHIREHGDVGLASRLIAELQVNKDSKLAAAAGINVQGLRFWFGEFCPVEMDLASGKWSLIKTKTDKYNKWVDARTTKYGAPDEDTGPGGRAFFITAAANNPYYGLAEVSREQRANVRVIGVATLYGQVAGIGNQFQRAVDAGTFGGDTELAKEFIALMEATAKKFRDDHAKELMAEPDKLNEVKAALIAADKEDTSAKAKDDLEGTGAEGTAGLQNEVTPQVGGDVTSGMDPQVDDVNQQGTGTNG